MEGENSRFRRRACGCRSTNPPYFRARSRSLETQSSTVRSMAEGVGFEPTDGCPSLVFKTSAIDHSATLP